MRCVRLPYAGREVSGEFVRLKLKPDTDASALIGQDVMVHAGRLGEFRGRAVSRSDGILIIRPSVRNRIDAGAIPEEGIVETDTAKTDGSLGKRPDRSLLRFWHFWPPCLRPPSPACPVRTIPARLARTGRPAGA